MIYRFEAELWLYNGEGGSWCFMTVPPDISDGLKHLRGQSTGFGSIRVLARIGETAWRTSVFPHKQSGGFLLPVKAQVRRTERLSVGDQVTATLEIEI